MLILGIVEAALELIPEAIAHDSTVVTAAKTRRKVPAHTLLDESIHHMAMRNLSNNEKRGRPDIVHRSLLTALDSVFAREAKLQLFVHTYTGQIFEVNQQTRLPRRYNRFVGLMEQLLLEKTLPVQGQPLLQFHDGPIDQYVQSLQPTRTFLLEEGGQSISPLELARLLMEEAKPIVLVGGFAHGAITSEIRQLADQKVCIDPESLSTSTAIGMLLHSLENTLNLTEQRFSKAKR
ncbi:MAG: 16S rRNA methyltransferase [Promethearchaeota archaeon]